MNTPGRVGDPATRTNGDAPMRASNRESDIESLWAQAQREIGSDLTIRHVVLGCISRGIPLVALDIYLRDRGLARGLRKDASRIYREAIKLVA